MKRLSFRAQLLLALCAYSTCPLLFAADTGLQQQQQEETVVTRAIKVALTIPANPELAGLWMRALYRSYDQLQENEKWEFNEIIAQHEILQPEWQNGLSAATDDEMRAYHLAEKEHAPQFQDLFPQG